MSEPIELSELIETPFARRHIGPSAAEQTTMLARLGFPSLDALADAVVPAAIRDRTPLDGLDALPRAHSETEAFAALRAHADRNVVFTSLIGLGYSDCITPPVIRRNVLEGPGWYTAYTPYQSEISQGRLEAVVNFQTTVADLTAMPLANASLLDEATAAAEAMALLHRVNGSTERTTFVVDADTLPQTIAVVQVRARAMGLDVDVRDVSAASPSVAAETDAANVFGVLVQHPGASGEVRDLAPIVAAWHAVGVKVCVAADLLALCVLTPPGEADADVVVGTAQRFGVPLFYGGPHAGYIAVRDEYQRQLPGRLVGVSVDDAGRPAYRLALQTREQHIRREKATSNICTAQVLLAVVAGMYAVYHGPDGLRAIASRVQRTTAVLARGLREAGIDVVTQQPFDTITVRAAGRAAAVLAAARERRINLRPVDDDHVAIALDETTNPAIVEAVWAAFGVAASFDAIDGDVAPIESTRTSAFLTHPTFARFRSETDMLRYLRKLSDKDLALDRAMIPLGSCTMKLNATAEMEPISWSSFATMHPFAPVEQATGYTHLIDELERWLAAITGYDAVSLQPNAGSQGEYAGLLAIRAYHESLGQGDRDICLIPASAHGTNAASAAMAGLRVVVVKTDEHGNIDFDDLKRRAVEAGPKLSTLMMTYPSTHGVFEEHVPDVCALVHEHGGQVYVDGANLNALVGLARPGRFGADVSHLNLHKTFCIPHGGGGPGVGPVAVRAHLARFLPNHPLVASAGPATGVGPISAAPWGSAGILPIPWMYITMMGADGLAQATRVAILNANYVAARLAEHYPILYSGRGGLVAHECIVDLRPITKDTGVTVDDVAKRLIDYGFHAPTMSFPVAGTLMVEPTESESLAELDRFCDAMIAIRAEIDRVAAGEWPADDSPLRHAPHPAADVIADDWSRPYPRELGAYPPGVDRATKFWPPVSRIDSAYGDRNLFCSCPPLEAE
jgi:glycine dehydrogenase